MANAPVVRKTQTPTQIRLRAAQYVRMSTDYQQYSIDNQVAVIAAYAKLHDLSIVRTYRDDGESGLRIKNRSGLSQLLEHVRSGDADFEYILVYDISRWGRFQDVDESAYYEFICKQAGMRVRYCAEQFEDDGTLLSSLAKSLKRVMAAEFSRELSAKVHAGQCRLTRLGLKQGGPIGYGLRRVLVDQHLKPKHPLLQGERKYLQTDHVKLCQGSSEEAAVVRWIFHQFVVERKSAAKISSELNERKVPNKRGQPWNHRLVLLLLKNENYIGNLVYNRISHRLGQKAVYNPPDIWIRGIDAVEPIVERHLFLRAQKILKERRVDISEDEMLRRLRITLKKEGRLTTKIINDTVGLPSTATYMEHFGSIRNAYRLIGYTTKRDCDWIDSYERWAGELAGMVRQTAVRIERSGARTELNASGDLLLVNGKLGISFRVARQLANRAGHNPRWSFYLRRDAPRGWVAVIRLTESKQEIFDYLLFPTEEIGVGVIKFAEKARIRLALQFETADALVRAIVTRARNAPSRASRSPSRVRSKVHSKNEMGSSTR